MTEFFVSETTICDFLGQSVEFLRTIIPADQHKWHATTIDRRPNGYTVHGSTRPDISTIMNMAHLQGRLQFVNSAAEALKADTRYQRIHHENTERWDGTPWYWLEPEQVVFSILNEYVHQLNGLDYDEQTATQISRRFLHSLERGRSSTVSYTVVRGLECDFERHQFPGGILLRRLTDPETCRLIDNVPALLEDEHLPANRCVLEKAYRVPIADQPIDTNSAAVAFDMVVTALRLLREGRVDRQNTYARRENPGELAIVQTGATWHGAKRHPIQGTYSLSEADLPALDGIVKALNRGAIPRRLQTAVDRVNFAAERDRPDDQLLDVLIAMEALFGDSSGAIGYKIGMRCAAFVEKEYHKREHIRRAIADAYRTRSALVHGGRRTDASESTTRHLVAELLVCLRNSISRIIGQLLSGGGVPDPGDFDRLLLQPTQEES